ncbi:MAG: hypothetical protein JXR58_12915 [Bacteroidales bacterium]|nr:hypothetical protein [Bacteroidales bacterium]
MKQPLKNIAKLVFLLFLLGIEKGNSQQSYPYDLPQYSFINYRTNILNFPGDSSSYNKLFEKFTKLVTKGEGQLNVVHLGDSHIQADIFSGRMRERLQTFVPGLIGGRGFVFPYSVAKTNNPQNYKTSYNGTWEWCKNVETKKNCELGLSGISITSNDTAAFVTLVLNRKTLPVYDFNKVKVFHSTDSFSYKILVNGIVGETAENNNLTGFTDYYLPEYSDSICLSFAKTDSIQNYCTIHGISLETSDPGVVYHSLGINGANVNSFRYCSLFSPHLQAINPDWIIISMGTNDGYVAKLDSLLLEENFGKLVDLAREKFPEIPVLITVPGDNYRYRKTPNQNNKYIRNLIFRIAKEKNCAVWDFYTVMGGYRSVNYWEKENLAAGDKLHFTSKGYILQGDLLFTAFLKSFDNYLEKTDLPE